MTDDLFSWIALFVTGAIAIHGLTYKDKDGTQPFVHLLFGAMALMFFLRFLFQDILGIW